MGASSRTGLACPHCNARMRIRSSRAIGELYRQIILQCSRVECGASYGGSFSINYQIAPSREPNPGINLPVSPPRIPANDDRRGPEVPLRPAANDGEDEADRRRA